jgi:hypothetical protein
MDETLASDLLAVLTPRIREEPEGGDPLAHLKIFTLLGEIGSVLGIPQDRFNPLVKHKEAEEAELQQTLDPASIVIPDPLSVDECDDENQRELWDWMGKIKRELERRKVGDVVPRFRVSLISLFG